MASSPPEESIPPPGTTMRGTIDRFDWAATPLGPRRAWPACLRVALDLCLDSCLPTILFWGDDLRMLFNDAWAEAAGEAATSALGQPAARVLASIWPAVGPQFETVLKTGQGLALADQMLPALRDGQIQDTYWQYSLTPVRDEEGRVVGILNQGLEVTRSVLAERRLSFLIRLADRLRGIDDPEEVKQAAISLLGEYLDTARVGYAEVDAARGVVVVRSEWTCDSSIGSLAGRTGALASFGEEALAFLRSGEVLALEDVQALPPSGGNHRPAWRNLGVRALIAVPLVRDGELKVLLYVQEPQPRRWTRAEAAITRDVAERTWAAVERAQAETSLRESEDHYRHTVELNPQVTWTALPDGQLNRVTPRWTDWTGTTGLGRSWAEGLHPDDRERTLAAWAHSVRTGEPYDIEHRVQYRDGRFRWARSRAFPRHDTEGNICLWYGATEDIHEQKVAEEHQRLLINELNHRVKNTLATVQAIAFQTLKGDVPLDEARARFESRLMALSQAHNLLTEQNWGGASLDRIVRDATEHLSGEQPRFKIEGEPIWLSPRAALALALALHELGTNAAKHGALSTEGGCVSISWREEGEAMWLEWKETGGPRVRAPARRGFGSRLIEQGLAADLGGTARLDFEADGLRCRIEASRTRVRNGEAAIG